MHPPDDLSPMAVALAWSSRIMTVALEMVLPGLLGYWVDIQLGSTPWIMLLAFAFGGTTAMLHLIQMTKVARDVRVNERAEDEGKSDR